MDPSASQWNCISTTVVFTAILLAIFANSVQGQDPEIVPPPPPANQPPGLLSPSQPTPLIPPSPGEALSLADLQAIETELRNRLEEAPNDEELILKLAIVLKEQGKDLQAIRLLYDARARNPYSRKIAMGLGQLYLQADRVECALSIFESVQCAEPCMDDLNYWLGTAQLRSGSPLTAYRTLLRGHHSNDKMAKAQQLVRGASLASLGLQEEACYELMGVYSCTDDPELRSSALEIKREIDNALGEIPRLRGSMKLGVRYDDNPGVVPSTNILGFEQPDVVDSWGNSVIGQLTYDLYRGYNREVVAGYTLFHTSNYDDHQFDLVDNAVFLAAAERGLIRETPYVSAIRLDYDHLGVGSEAFLGRVAVTPSFTLVDTDFSSTTGLFRYSINDYLGQGVFDNTVLDADSDDYAIGLFRQYRLHDDTLQLLFGYQYDRNFSQGGNIDYNGHNVQIGMAWLTPWDDLQFNVLGQIYDRDYTNPDVFAMQRRSDLEYVLQAGMIYPLSDEWYATFSWLLDRNTSNLAQADYKRQLFEIGIQYNFPQGNEYDPTLLRHRTTY